MLFRILAVGDVVGNPGLDFAAKNLRRIKKEVGADFVVVNGENANVVGGYLPDTNAAQSGCRYL